MNTLKTSTKPASVLIASPEAGGPATYVETLVRELPVPVSVLGFNSFLSLPPILRHLAFALTLATKSKRWPKNKA